MSFRNFLESRRVETIKIGDEVVIVGNSAYEGISGRVVGFKEGKIVVDMLEQGKVRFAPERVKLLK